MNAARGKRRLGGSWGGGGQHVLAGAKTNAGKGQMALKMVDDKWPLKRFKENDFESNKQFVK